MHIFDPNTHIQSIVGYGGIGSLLPLGFTDGSTILRWRGK